MDLNGEILNNLSRTLEGFVHKTDRTIGSIEETRATSLVGAINKFDRSSGNIESSSFIYLKYMFSGQFDLTDTLLVYYHEPVAGLECIMLHNDTGTSSFVYF